MGFFDLDEFVQEADKISILPHPLADKLSLDKKISYLGMLFFAAAVDDGKVSDGEIKKFWEIGFSLKLQESDINETKETVVGLLTNASKMAFVKEAVSLLQEREIAMFLYCDMVCVMVADGELSHDAEKFLDGMTKFLELEENDCCFLKEYSAFMPADKKSKAAEFIYCFSEKFDLPDKYLNYFTPTEKEMQSTLQEQADYLTKIIDLLAVEKGENAWPPKQIDLSYEQKDLLQLFQKHNIDSCKKSSNNDLLKNHETLTSFCRLITTVMKEKFKNPYIEAIIHKLISDIKNNVETHEFVRIKELDIKASDFSPFPLVGDYGDGLLTFKIKFTHEKTVKIFKEKYYESLEEYKYHTSYLEYTDSFGGKMLWHLILLKSLLMFSSEKQEMITSLCNCTIPKLRIELGNDYKLRIDEVTISCYKIVGENYQNYHSVKQPFEFYSKIKNGPSNTGFSSGYDITRAFDGYKKSINDFYAFLEELHFYNAQCNIRILKTFIQQFAEDGAV